MQFQLNLPLGVLSVALFLLCGNYSRAGGDSFVFVSLLQDRKIVTFSRHVESGELVRQHETICPAEPAFLAASNDGKTLFVSMRSLGQLAAYRIDPANGTLTLINTVDGGDDPAFLVSDRSGKFLLTAYYVSNKVTVHRTASSGRISESPVQSLSTAANAHGIAIDSKNETVYVSHTGANRIYQLDFDATTGRLTPLDPPFVSAKAGQRPRHIVLHPSDNWAYCSNEAGDSEEDGTSMYNRDAVSKSLSLSQSLSSVPDDFDANKNSTARCLITPDSRFLYVANRGHDSIAGYEINQMSGQLTRIAVTPTEAVPRSFTITPDGRHLYVAGEASGRVAGYRITVAGRLEPIGSRESGPVSWAILAVDPQRLSPAGM